MCKRRGKRTTFYSQEVGKVDIHPSSVNAGAYTLPLPYIVYSERVKTNISDFSLVGSLCQAKLERALRCLEVIFIFLRLRVSYNSSRFYAAEVVLALEYLHMLGIIYRDLKPENVLIWEDGHIMPFDFDLSLTGRVSPTIIKASYTYTNSSKGSGDCVSFSCFSTGFLRDRFKKDINVSRLNIGANSQVTPLPELAAEPTQTRSRSFMGTYEYMAPEIFRGNEHGSVVDWWTLGIVLYELLFGMTPFKGINSNNAMCNVVANSISHLFRLPIQS